MEYEVQPFTCVMTDSQQAFVKVVLGFYFLNYF